MCRWTPPPLVPARIAALCTALMAAAVAVWLAGRKHLQRAQRAVYPPMPTQELIEEYEELHKHLDENIHRQEREIDAHKARLDALRDEIEAYESERINYARENP